VIKIESFCFGAIAIDGKKYHRDVIIFPDGMVKKEEGSSMDVRLPLFQKGRG